MQACLVEHNFPLRWVPSAVSDGTLQQVDNGLVYTLLETEMDATTISARHSTSEQNAIHQLEVKVNVLLHMMSRLLEQHIPAPQQHWVKLATDQISFQSTNAPATGTRLEITLFPHERLPLPLYLRGTVRHVAEGWIQVDLSFTGEEQDNWSRWLFRQHRRFVAQKKHPA